MFQRSGRSVLQLDLSSAVATWTIVAVLIACAREAADLEAAWNGSESARESLIDVLTMIGEETALDCDTLIDVVIGSEWSAAAAFA